MEVIHTEKGKPCALYKGYAYRKYRQNKQGVVTWVCLKEKSSRCKGRLVTKNDVEVRVTDHQCIPDDASLEVKKRTCQAKKQVREYSDTPIAQPGSSNERVIIKEEVEVDEESSINQSEQTEDEFMENWEQNDPCDDSNSGNTELGNSNYLERPVSPLEMKRCLKEEEAIKNQDLNNILRTTDIITGLNEMNSKQPKMPVGLMNNRGLHSSTELEDYLKTVIKKQEELININIELARFNLEKAKMEADINLQKMENLKLENQLLKFQLQKEKNNCHS